MKNMLPLIQSLSEDSRFSNAVHALRKRLGFSKKIQSTSEPPSTNSSTEDKGRETAVGGSNDGTDVSISALDLVIHSIASVQRGDLRLCIYTNRNDAGNVYLKPGGNVALVEDLDDDTVQGFFANPIGLSGRVIGIKNPALLMRAIFSESHPSGTNCIILIDIRKAALQQIENTTDIAKQRELLANLIRFKNYVATVNFNELYKIKEHLDGDPDKLRQVFNPLKVLVNYPNKHVKIAAIEEWKKEQNQQPPTATELADREREDIKNKEGEDPIKAGEEEMAKAASSESKTSSEHPKEDGEKSEEDKEAERMAAEWDKAMADAEEEEKNKKKGEKAGEPTETKPAETKPAETKPEEDKKSLEDHVVAGTEFEFPNVTNKKFKMVWVDEKNNPVDERVIKVLMQIAKGISNADISYGDIRDGRRALGLVAGHTPTGNLLAEINSNLS